MSNKSSRERAEEVVGMLRERDRDGYFDLDFDAADTLIAAAIDDAVGVERDEIAAELALAKLGTEENYGSGRVTHYYRCDVSNWIKARGKVG
jgi:hypothetical protein